jgi:predicted HTH domain antitoxin
VLHKAGPTEPAARIEIACRLFDASKLALPMAGRLAGLNRVEMERALASRNVPIDRPTVEDVKEDLETLWRMRT